MTKLEELIKKLVREAPPMTPAQLWDQRVSFAYGNASLSNSNITKEMVIILATEVYGARPIEVAVCPVVNVKFVLQIDGKPLSYEGRGLVLKQGSHDESMSYIRLLDGPKSGLELWVHWEFIS